MLGSLTLDRHRDVDRAQASLDQLIMRHPLLQAVVDIEGTALHFVKNTLPYTTLELVHTTDFSQVYQDAQNWPVNPRERLIQCRLAQSDSEPERGSYIVFLLHHCISDGGCVAALLNEFMEIYSQVSAATDEY